MRASLSGATQATRDEPDVDDRHVVRIVDWLLQFAFEQRASDIHLEPCREQGNGRFRIDGVLHRVRQLPTDGRLETRPPRGQGVELRPSAMPTTFGEQLVMRIFDPQVLVRSMAELGLAGEQLARWQALSAAPDGMLIVTGPTGSASSRSCR